MGVGLGDVVGLEDAEMMGGGVDPVGRAFDLGDVADGGAIDDYVTLAVGPLGTKFLIDESGLIAEGGEDGVEGGTIRDSEFVFDAGLVLAGTAFGLVGELPSVAVFADAEDLATGAESLVWRVVKSVHFVCGRSLLAEAGIAEAGFKRGNVWDEEFDFDFQRRRHEEIVEEGTKKRLARRYLRTS